MSSTKTSMPFSGLAAVLIALTGGPAHATASDDLDAALSIYDRLDEVRVVIDAREESAERVVSSIASQLPVPLEADWSALQMIGVSRHDEVTLRAADAAARAAIDWLLLEMGDEFGRPVLEIFADRALITTREAATAFRFPVAYDLRDLLADAEAWGLAFGSSAIPEASGPLAEAVTEPPRTLESPAPSMNEPHDDDEEAAESESDADGGSGGDEPGPPPPPSMPAPRTAAEALMRLILDHVDPDAWYGYGGDRARVDLLGEVVLVTASPSIHRDIVALIEQLRDLQKSPATLEAALLELPVERLDQLHRRYGASGSALVQTMVLDRTVRVLWRRTLAVTAEHEASLRIEGEEGWSDIACTLTRTGTDQPMAMLRVSGETPDGWTYQVEQPFPLAGRRPGAAILLGRIGESSSSDADADADEASTLARVLAVRRLN